MSFCGTPDAALAAELLQEYIKDTVGGTRERLERDLMMSPSTSLRIDNISLRVADYLEKVGLQQQRKTFSFLRSEAAYYRNRREKSKTVILGQIGDMYRGTEVSLQKVQGAYSQRAVSLPADTRRDVEAQLASLKLTQDHLKSVEDMASLFFDRYGDALHILALPKEEFVKVTKAVLVPTPLVSHMCAAEGYVSVLRASWVADDAALQRATAVFVQARRDLRYDRATAAAELLEIKKDVDVTAQRTRAAIDGIKAISSSIKGPAVISSSSAYLSGRSVVVEDLLQARTRFNRILDCVNGCRKDANHFCATVRALMMAIEDAPITCGRSC
ncbi:hypothetical protein OH76DRAFT_1487962 [Lentinus brumalis]|uniref:Uncharacterized protein n=1 Tax=Lentinus brumalis TaxID=2498619 RepID=A0A371CSK5_9APHY|nr:hypothetical protein OH76DRAFT_1487962 [Polyporus brumalis]